MGFGMGCAPPLPNMGATNISKILHFLSNWCTEEKFFHCSRKTQQQSKL